MACSDGVVYSGSSSGGVLLLMQQRQRWHAAYIDGEGYMMSALVVDGFVVRQLGTALSEVCVNDDGF